MLIPVLPISWIKLFFTVHSVPLRYTPFVPVSAISQFSTVIFFASFIRITPALDDSIFRFLNVTLLTFVPEIRFSLNCDNQISEFSLNPSFGYKYNIFVFLSI